MSELPDPERFLRILDVGCGTGNWLLEVAEAYPNTRQLLGIDASPRIVEVAQTQAQASMLEKKVQFRVMNALGTLGFPNNSFDLVNMRFGGNFLRTWEWRGLLSEIGRITKAGGVVRITESDMVESNSSLVTSREELILHAFYQSGHYFTEQKDGLTSELEPLLHQQGYAYIQTRVHTIDYLDGGVGQQLLAKYLGYGFQMLQPFLRKWTRTPEKQEDLSQQLLSEMQQPEFTAIVKMKTIWGIRP